MFVEFREELIRNLIDLDEYAEPPLYRPHPPLQNKLEFQTNHKPVFSDTKRNFKSLLHDHQKKNNESLILLQCTKMTVVKVTNASGYGMTKSSMKSELI